MEWYKYRLKDIAVSIQTGPFGSQLHQSDYSEAGTPVVMPKDMVGGEIVTQSIARVSDEHVNRLRRHKVKAGDILYSRRGDVGRCALITEREEGWLCGTGCLKVQLDSNKVLPSFVFYILQRKDSVAWVENHAVGSTMPNLNTDILKKLPLRLPVLAAQRRIASILSAYDNLIENNNKRIRLLEQTAENLYKEWFVRFRFPGHEKVEFENGLPKGWMVLLLSELFNFQEGPGIRNWQYVEKNGTKFINIRCINDKDIDIDSANMISTEEANGKYKHFLLKENDIVMSCSGSLGRSAIVRKCHLPLCLNTSVIRFWPKSKDDFSFLYGYLTSTEFINRQQEMASGSAQVNFGPMHLKKIKLLVPNENVRKQYQEFVLPILEEQNRLKDQNTLLTRQRDLLLPRLMSGKLEVKVKVKE